MNRPNRRQRLNVNAPVVSLFISAVFGVLLDEWLSPGLVFWRLCFGFSIICLVFSFSVRGVHFLFHHNEFNNNVGDDLISVQDYQRDSSRRLGSFVFNLRSKIIYGNVCSWIAIGSFFGYRHDAFVNYYPTREISRYISKEGSPYSLELKVCNTPYVYLSNDFSRPINGSLYVTRFVADVLFVKDVDKWEPLTGRVAVTIDGKASFIRTGDRIRVTGRLAPPRKKGNPSDLDLVQYYRSQRILTSLSITSVNNVEVEEEDSYPTRIAVARFFERLRKKAGSILSERLSPRNAAVARGMTLGFRNDVEEQTNDSFRKTGTIHLLAISGLHIALVVGVFVFVLRSVGAPVVVVSIATIALTLFYLCLTDMRAPVIRASILIITLCVGSLIGRRGTTLNTLAFAAILIIAANPCELFQLGAQLSFLATGAFLWSGGMTIREKADSTSFRREYVRERNRDMKASKEPDNDLPRSGNQGNIDTSVERIVDYTSVNSSLMRFCKSTIRRVGKSLWERTFAVVKASWCIWFVSAPLLLRTTNLFTPLALIANPLIWLPATIALLLAFCLIIVGLASEVCSGRLEWLVLVLGNLTDSSYSLFLGTLDFMASPSFASFHLSAPPLWLLWCFYIPLVLWTLCPFLRPKKLFLSIAFLLWFVVAITTYVCQYASWGNTRLRVEVLSVGHGCAVLGVFSDGRSFLYDCGSISNTQRAAEIVAKELWNSHRNHIDIAIVSHADFDHYGGISPLIDLVHIDRLCVSPMMFLKESAKLSELEGKLKEKGIAIESVSAGESLERLGFPELSVLHPPADASVELDAESNANSLVVVVDYGGRRILFPGDLDASDAKFLSDPPTFTDLLLAPHHGGKSNNLDELLRWTTPKWIVISGGTFQRNQNAERELQNAGYCLLHTYDDGLIQVDIRRPRLTDSIYGRMTIRSYRTEKRYESAEGKERR